MFKFESQPKREGLVNIHSFFNCKLQGARPALAKCESNWIIVTESGNFNTTLMFAFGVDHVSCVAGEVHLLEGTCQIVKTYARWMTRIDNARRLGELFPPIIRYPRMRETCFCHKGPANVKAISYYFSLLVKHLKWLNWGGSEALMFASSLPVLSSRQLYGWRKLTPSNDSNR